MISGLTLLILTLSLTAPAAFEQPPEEASRTADPELEALVHALSRHAGETLTFRETRHSDLLDAPLELRGRLLFNPPDRFEKIIESPYRESQLVAEGRVWIDREGRRTRSFSLARAPELAALMEALAKLLSGDSVGLEANFEIHLETHAQDWRLELSPRDPALARHVESVRLRGTNSTLTLIETHLADGNIIRTEIGVTDARDQPTFIPAGCLSPSPIPVIPAPGSSPVSWSHPGTGPQFLACRSDPLAAMPMSKRSRPEGRSYIAGW